MSAVTDWPKAVIFDLDGTLVDSAPDICRAVNAAFAPLGMAPIDVPAARQLIGGGAAKALLRATAKYGLGETEVDQAALLERFMPVYIEESKHGRGLYPGALEVLRLLRDQGVKLAICTNKAQPVTDVVVDVLQLEQYCDVIVGARDGAPKKPDPKILESVIDALGVSAKDTAMIGDSSADVGAAKGAGIPIVVMSYGYTPDPHALGADLVIDHLSEVPAALKKI